MGKVKKKEYYGEDKLNFVVALVQEGMSATKATQTMCDKYGLPHSSNVERTYRDKLQRRNLSVPTVSITDEYQEAKSRVFDSQKKYYLISWAQQESPIHEDFLTNIEAYATYLNASIHVVAGRYKSLTSLEGSKQQKEKEKDTNYWHPRLRPYLDANRQNLHTHLSLLADVKIQPTASTPLSGFNSITALESCIIGHPRVHLKSLPVLDGYPNKLLLSTGAVTLPNYTDTKAGKKAEFHHTLGFVIVELDGDIFHVRQIQCGDDGSFYDLNKFISNGEIFFDLQEYPAVVFGDLHLTEEDEVAVNKAFEIAKWSKAKEIIVHDVFSGVSISPHESHNPVVQAQREKDGSNNLADELEYMYDWFNSRQEFNFVSVMSNHPLWLDRWIVSNDWRKSPNRVLYLELASIAVSGFASKGLVPYLLERETNNVKVLGYNDSHRVASFELSLHYDLGNAGSRGGMTQFKNLNTKSIGGHGHNPQKEDGAMMVGTLTKLRLSYNKGLSNWIQGVVLIYPNNKASHINIIKGKYSTLI